MHDDTSPVRYFDVLRRPRRNDGLAAHRQLQSIASDISPPSSGKPSKKAPSEWHEANVFHFNEDPAFDAAADVRESEEHLARHRQERAARLARKPWWARLF
jgi:hypothetical protein